MPEVTNPLIPLSETTQFGEIPAMVGRLAGHDPRRFAGGLILFAVVPQPTWKTEPLRNPPVIERAMIACLDTQMGETVINALQMIEPRDALRLGVPPGPRPIPLMPREKLSVRKVFQWMETASATVVTYSISQHLGENLVGFLRTKETIENFLSEWKMLTKATDGAN